MKRLLLLFLFLLFLLPSFAQLQEPVLVRGFVLSDDRNDVIPLASILNQSSGKRYISNRQGLFRVLVAPGDTLLLSAIGYANRLMSGYEMMPAVADDTIRVILKPTAYRLRDVNIIYSNTKRDSIARAAAEFLKTDPLLNNYDRVLGRQKGGLMNPLTAMYEAFSKEGNDAVRFEEFLRYAEKQRAVDSRYNKKVVKRATGLPDEQLDSFMQFCKLDRNFVINAQEYDLILAIRNCADQFRSRRH